MLICYVIVSCQVMAHHIIRMNNCSVSNYIGLHVSAPYRAVGYRILVDVS